MKQKKVYRFLFLVGLLVLFLGMLGGVLGAFFLSLARDKFNVGEIEVSDVLQSQTDGDYQTVASVKKASPAVVSIVVSKDLSKYFNNYFFPGFSFPLTSDVGDGGKKNQYKQKIGGGTGFIISSDGMIITNKHVVNDDGAQYSVITKEGKEYDAVVVGRDPLNDFAVVKIKPDEPLSVLELGDSDNVEIGQTVIAIGYSLGEFRDTVTKGIISGINRKILAGSDFGSSEFLEGALQTDAAINPGNSGGPLLDLNGRVVGINTAVSRSGQLIGFAIPINSAKTVIEGVRKFGKVVRPFLGVRYVLVNDEFARKAKIDINYGALLLSGEVSGEPAVVPDSPADRIGLRENDIILGMNGKQISLDQTLLSLLSGSLPGDTVELNVWRNSQVFTKSVVLGEYDENNN